jgi:hypothetical protein
MTTLAEKIDIDDLIHNLTYEEVWAMGRGAKPVQMNWLAGDFDENEENFTTKNGSVISSNLLDLMQYNPMSASLEQILTYCKAIDFDPIVFIKTVLEKK